MGTSPATVATAVDRFGRLDIMFNNVGIPTPRLGMAFEDHTVEDLDRLTAVNFRGVFLGCKYAVIQFKKQGGGGVILNTGSVAGLVGWGGTVYGATKGAVHQLTKAVAVEAAPFGIRVNAICPAGMPYTNFMAAGGMDTSSVDIEQIAQHTGSMHPLGRPITAEDCAEAAVYLCSDRAVERHGRPAPHRRGLRRSMTDTQDVLDLDRVRRLFDLASSTNAHNGGNYREDPYPVWRRASRGATVHEGTVHELSGVQQDFMFHGLPYPDRPHFSTFSWAACDAAYRNPDVFASSPDAVDLENGEIGPTNSMLSMGGAQHRRYRASSSRRSRPRRPPGGSRTGSTTPSMR